MTTQRHGGHELRRRLTAVVMAAALVLAACGDDDSTDTADTTSSSSSSSSTSTGDTSSTSAASSSSTTSSTTAATSAPGLDVVTFGRLMLLETGLGDGVGSFGGEGSAVLLEVAAEMAAAGFGGPEGSPTSDFTYVVEDADSTCHGMEIRKTSWGDLSVIIQVEGGAETFIGWTLGDNDGAPTGLTTRDGVAIGTSRSDVEALWGSAAFEDETEGRFHSPDLPAYSGVLDTAATVTILSAGTDCRISPI